MAFGKKADYAPLLGPGRHVMTLQRVHDLCVAGFPGNQRRLHLFQKFEEFLQRYLVSEVVGDVWLNGSFMTEKPEPGDVDVTVIVCPEAASTLSDEQVDLLEATQNENLFSPEIDAFAFIELGKDHPDYLDEYLNPARTWYEQYGSENSKEWLKGFGVIKLRETHVGLRLCS